MMSQTREAIGVIALVAGLAAPAMANTTVWNNGGPGANPWASQTVTSRVQADDFLITEDSALTGARVYLNEKAGSTWSTSLDLFNGLSGTFQYLIFSDEAGSPGSTPIAGGVLSGVPMAVHARNSGGTWWSMDFNFEDSVAVNSGAYWIGIHAGQPGDMTARPVYWASSAEAMKNRSSHFNTNGSFDPWNPNSNVDFSFSIFATAVPAPGAMGLFAVGGLMAMRRRR